MPVVGMGNVRAEVDIQIDYTEEESTYEEYDGNNNGPKARSEVLSLDQDGTQLAEGVPGATTNTVPAQPTTIVNGQLDSSEKWHRHAHLKQHHHPKLRNGSHCSPCQTSGRQC